MAAGRAAIICGRFGRWNTRTSIWIETLMGIRETIQQNSTLVAIAALVVAGGVLFYSYRSNTSGPPLASSKVFATVDEGKTVFETEITNLPPFEYEGKTAYRVWMFTTDGGKTRFPGYLERLTPEAKKRADAYYAARQSNPSGPRSAPYGPADVEVKKPGASNPWVKSMSPEGAAVTSVAAPSGGEVDVVTP